jgi:prolipoprotein diacylglyceryltransferase
VIHLFFESLAYFAGYRIYLHLRRRAGDFLEDEHRLWIVCAAVVGAAIGSKVVYWLEDPRATLRHWTDLVFLMQGKTIVGGLIGGTLAVEWLKRRLGVVRRTGDLFAIPLCVGMAIGRIGCFCAGLSDQTYGIATSLPWGVDFGDGIRRHPTQLYEVAFLLALALLLRRQTREGNGFNAFLIAYMAFRLAIDFLKPGTPTFGLTGIQWACIACIIWRGSIFWEIASVPISSTTPPLLSVPRVTAGPMEK